MIDLDNGLQRKVGKKAARFEGAQRRQGMSSRGSYNFPKSSKFSRDEDDPASLSHRSTGSGDPHARCRGTAFCELLRRSRESPAVVLLRGPGGGGGSGRNARSIQDASFGEIRRQLTYKSEWRDKIPIAVDRWYASSKTCSKCRHVLDELRLDVRYWTCPKCRVTHDRDINAARNLLMEGLRQLAARDERDLRVDAGDTCPEEILVQVLADGDGVQFTRSGRCNRACLEQARLH
jgi:transposase